MVFYQECTTDGYNELKKDIEKDDEDLKKYVQGLNHRELNFVILNLGNMIQICAIYFDLKQDNIKSYLKLEKEKLRTSRMKTIVNELNQTINLRFDLPEDSEVIKGLFVYDGEGYIHINKMTFINLLKDKEEYPNI